MLKAKGLDSPIKSGNDGSVDSTVPDYVIPWLACRAVASGEGWTTESTTYYLYTIRVAMQYNKSLRNKINFYPPLVDFFI